MAETPNQPAAWRAPAAERRGIDWTPRLIIWTVIVVALLVFTLQNFDDQPVNLLFWEVSPPLSVILLLFGLAGYILGWLRPHFRPRRRP